MKRPRRSHKNSSGMTRRDVLRLGATVAAGAAVGPFISTPARAQAFNWQRFRGKELFLLLYKHPWVEEMVKHVPEFESLSGMKVKYEVLPEVQGRQKFVVEMTAGSGGIDAWHASMHVEKRRAWKFGWFQPLNKFLEDKTLTAPDFDWNDFTQGSHRDVTQPDKSISAIPTFVDPFTLFYRKDLFQQKGIAVPKTMAELEEAAKKLHDPPRMYGFVARGLKNANATPWAWVIYSFGGEYLTKDGKSALNTPPWPKAMDWYAGMLRRFAPPGVVNFNWYECSSAFMQGQVAIYYDGVNFANQFEDPSKSKIAGKVGYAVLPAGPVAHVAPTFTNAMAISAQSRNKEAAYFYCQWATNKLNCKRELLSGVGVARISPWDDPEVQAKPKMPRDWYSAYLGCLKIGRAGLPEIMDVTQYRDIIGVAIQRAIEGTKSADAIAQADKEFQALLDKTEK
ncbi:MAG TPA: sugar ABC transporter substrate-binding protein [Candidatus Methylomirabilis sp.]|nr:sugar ABC transporter substrate-binding protein [Candidatus Methylomirabilis sp.]